VPARSIKRAKVGFFSTPSCTPDVTVLAAKANTFTNAVWMPNRKVKAKDGAVAPACHVGLGDVQRIEQGHNIVGHES